jgi:hypothetical protein
MIRFEKTDTEKSVLPDDGGVDASGITRGRVIHFKSRPHEPLWNECVMCHRKGTLVETPATGEDESVWTCRKCGEVNLPDEIHAYFDNVMDNEVNMPECPPIMMAAMSRYAKMLFEQSEGEHVSRAEAGNAARHLIRLVERYGAEQEAWFDNAEE